MEDKQKTSLNIMQVLRLYVQTMTNLPLELLSQVLAGDGLLQHQENTIYLSLDKVVRSWQEIPNQYRLHYGLHIFAQDAHSAQLLNDLYNSGLTHLSQEAISSNVVFGTLVPKSLLSIGASALIELEGPSSGHDEPLACVKIVGHGHYIIVIDANYNITKIPIKQEA